MIQERLQQLIRTLGWSQDRLSKEIVTNPSTVSRWLGGKMPPSKTSLKRIAHATGCNLHWLATGNGEMFPQTNGEIAATIGSPRMRDNVASYRRHPPKNETESQEESDRYHELMERTSKVITSKTIYRPALERNIDAFYKAVETEDEMQEVKEEIRAMQLKHDADMEELKEMIRSLGGAMPKKKGLAS